MYDIRSSGRFVIFPTVTVLGTRILAASGSYANGQHGVSLIIEDLKEPITFACQDENERRRVLETVAAAAWSSGCTLGQVGETYLQVDRIITISSHTIKPHAGGWEHQLKLVLGNRSLATCLLTWVRADTDSNQLIEEVTQTLSRASALEAVDPA